jgi:SAM-dependent methyltransferase
MNKNIRRVFRFFQKRLTKPAPGRHCPICERDSDHFGPYGLSPRADARCPVCGSLERHRMIWLFLKRKTDLFTKLPAKALHIAPERALEIKFRKVFGAGYLTADLLVGGVDLKMDICNIEFPDDTFDFILCSHVLEHVPDDRKAMREFRRVLSRRGVAILLVPIITDKTFEDPTIEDPKERLRLFGQEDHVRSYGTDYMDRLIEAGFRVEKLSPADFLPKHDITRMGVTPAAGDLFICRK